MVTVTVIPATESQEEPGDIKLSGRNLADSNIIGILFHINTFKPRSSSINQGLSSMNQSQP